MLTLFAYTVLTLAFNIVHFTCNNGKLFYILLTLTELVTSINMFLHYCRLQYLYTTCISQLSNAHPFSC